MKVTVHSRHLPLVPNKVVDSETQARTFLHPFRGKSVNHRSLTVAGALPLGIVANSFREYPLGTPAVAIAAPLIFTAALDAAGQSRAQFRDVYPAAKAKVERQRERVAARTDANASSRIDRASVGALHEEVVLDRLEAERKTANRTRWLSPFRAVALVGYGGAATSGTVGGVARLAGAAAPVASTVAVVGSSIAAPAQGIMLVVSAAEAATGVGRLSQLKADRKALGELDGMAPDSLLGGTREAIGRQRRYAAIKVGADSLNVVAQGASLAGSVLTLSGVGAVAGAPLATVGIVSVIGSGLIGGVTSSKKQKFMGVGANHLAVERAGQRNLAERLDRPGGMNRVLQQMSREHDDNQQTLVTAKLMSLVTHVLDREDKHAAPSARLEQLRSDKVAALVESGRKHVFARTSLLPAERVALRERFHGDFLGTNFFSGSANDVRRRVRDVLQSDGFIAELGNDELVQQRAMTKTVKTLRHSKDPAVTAFMGFGPHASSKTITVEALAGLARGSPEAAAVQLQMECRGLAKEAKRAASWLRADIVTNVVDLARTQRAISANDREGVSLAPASRKNESTWL